MSMVMSRDNRETGIPINSTGTAPVEGQRPLDSTLDVVRLEIDSAMVARYTMVTLYSAVCMVIVSSLNGNNDCIW